MTEKEIDALEAGPEMNALIHEHLMGLPVSYIATAQKGNLKLGHSAPYEACMALCVEHTIEGDEYWTFKPKPSGNPKYSTKWEFAGKVLEKLRETQKFCCLKLESDYNYVYTFSLTLSGDDQEHKPRYTTTEESPMLAICKTALKSIF